MLARYCVEQFATCGLEGVRGGEADEVGIRGFGRQKDWDLAYVLAGKPRLLVSLKSILKNISGTVPNRLDDLMGEAANVQQLSPEVVMNAAVAAVSDPAIPREVLEFAAEKNVGYLADYGWSFDLQVFAGQMQSACALVDACPRVGFVLQHAGMLEDLSDAGRAAWRRAMSDLAARPNAYVKLSGFGTFVHRVDADLIGWLWSETVALFGAERCLWGSNFPIEKLWTDYSSLLDAHRAAAAALGDAESRAIFHDTARRVYRL
jgi:predicted TIM-barrel fold metal-dependent hydrolase